MTRICLSLLLLCLLASGCRRQDEASASDQARFPLPGNWPLAEISVPEDALPEPLPGAFPSDEGNEFMSSGMPFNERTENAGKMWSVAYGTGLSWEEQREQFSQQHDSKAWQLNWDKPLTREFISTDGIHITQLHLDVDSGATVLSIFEYDTPWPGTQPFGT